MPTGFAKGWLALISIIAMAMMLSRCGTEVGGQTSPLAADATPTPTPTPTTDGFAVQWSDISTIIATNCDGSGCHPNSNGANTPQGYVDNQTLFDANLSANNSYLDTNLMPKKIDNTDKGVWDDGTGSDSSNRSLVLQYINERLDND